MTPSELRHLADKGDTRAQLLYAAQLQAAAIEAECHSADGGSAAAVAHARVDINTNTNAIPSLTPAQRHLLSLRHLPFGQRLDLLQEHKEKLPARPVSSSTSATPPPADPRYAEALRYLHRAAEAGDADAMRHLAKTYINAIGLPAPDEAQGDHWLRRAADLGHPAALCDLGIHAFGEGHREEALLHLQAAAAQDSPRAHYWLYHVYLSPAPQAPVDPFFKPSPENERQAAVHLEALAGLLDDEDAADHYELSCIYNDLSTRHPEGSTLRSHYQERHLHHLTAAARSDHEDALIDLCVHHYEAAPPDPELAERFLDRAIALNCPRAHTIRGELFREGKHLPADHPRAIRHYREAIEADPDYPEAHYLLAGMLAAGLGTRKNPKAAVRHFQIAADHGYADAHYSLSHHYRDGDGVPQDNEKLLHHLRTAADLDSPEAHYALGLIYEEGEILPRDPALAYAHMRNAAMLEFSEAHLWLALHHFEKTGKVRRFYRVFVSKKTTSDDTLASQHFHAAAEAGNADAQHFLGSLYEIGVIVPEDLEQAAHWFRLAAAQEHEGALKDLSKVEEKLAAARPKPPPIPPPVDYTQLIQLQQAAMQNDTAAQLALARLYLEGSPIIGGMRNNIAGFAWLLVSDDEGAIAEWEEKLTLDELTQARAIATQMKAALPPRSS